jgi:hypothetical protein
MGTPPVSLSETTDRFTAELDQIESMFYKCRGHSSVEGYVNYIPTEEGCLFALWDAWSRFLRSLVVTVSAGPTESLAGVTYAPVAVRTEADVLAYLFANKRGQNYRFVNMEPNWHDERAISDIVTVLALPNASTIIGAVTTTSVILGPIVVPSPITEIRTARNFGAHKNWKTLTDITAYGGGSFSNLSDHMRKRRSGVEAFSEWKESLEAIAASAAQ